MINRISLVKFCGDDHFKQYAGWGMLILATVIGFWTIRWGVGDIEADALVVGLRMQKGEVLYKEIFSHHFPFYYFWSSTVLLLFGKSIFWARASVWLFQILIFATLMKMTRFYLTIGATSLFWSIIRHIYQNNMLVYKAFSSLALLGIAILIILVVIDQRRFRIRHTILVSVLSCISVLSDPLTVYPISITIIVLWILKPKAGLQVVVSGMLLTAIFAGYLILTDTMSVFISDAIRFNSDIYSKYITNYASPLRFADIKFNLISGLDIFNPEWFNLDPYREITTHSDFDRWIFTGFFFRASAILVVILLLAQRNLLFAVYIYVVAAATLAIHPLGSYGVQFVPQALFFTAALITQELWSKTENRFRSMVHLAISVVVAGMAIWLCYRVIRYTAANLEDQSYVEYFSQRYIEYNKLKELSCGLPDVMLGYYPSNIYPYFFTEFPAVSRYYYLWPWIAEIALQEIIENLNHEDTLAIVHRRDNGLVFSQFDTRVYLQPLDIYLSENYIQVRTGIFISPELFARCPPK